MGRLAKLRELREMENRINQVEFPQPCIMTLEQRRASFLISYAMAMAADLKAKEPEKTALWNRLNATEDCLGKAIDFYRIQKFRNPDLRRASRLHNGVGELIKSLVPSQDRKRQIRRYWRHNQRHAKRLPRRSHDG